MAESAGKRSEEVSQEGGLASDEVQYDRVSGRLDEFEIISGSFLRQLFSILPFLIGLLLLADWLVGTGAFANDPLRLPTVLVTIVELFVIRSLYEKVPEALRVVWSQGLLEAAEGGGSVSDAFVGYLEKFEGALNHRFAHLVGGIFVIAGLFATFPMRVLVDPKRAFTFSPSYLFAYYTYGNAGFAAPLIGYLVGLLVWRVGVIAFFVTRLGKWFTLVIFPGHPDQSGGLKPLGDICLSLAYVLVVPAVYLGYWGFSATYFPNPKLEPITDLWEGIFRKWLLVLVFAGAWLFFQPLLAIHQQMKEYRERIQDELAELVQKMNRIARDLRRRADDLTHEQGGKMLAQLEFMEKAYQRSSQVPVWPFDWRVFRKFIAAQSIPILSLVGTSGPIIKIVDILTSLIQE